MPAPRASIYLGTTLSRFVAPLAKLLGSPTTAINAIADRYASILDQSRPELTLDEWCAVCEANNGIWSMSFGGGVPSLQFVEDNIAAEWSVDAAALNAALAALSAAGKLAVVEIVERFWAQANDARKPVLILKELLGDSKADPEMGVAAIAAELGVSARRVQQFFQDRRIAGVKRGADWFARRSALDSVRDRKPGRPAR